MKRGYATLPNCDGCGRFTSKPEIRLWCSSPGQGFHVCYEELLCARCAEKARATP